MLSTFSVTHRGEGEGDGTQDDTSALDDPRMDAAMAEFEREMQRMDSENPDPRHMARMMRRMSELTGEPVPAALHEVIARMEKGEDPDALEEEYGDALDEAMGADGGTSEGFFRSSIRLMNKNRPPVRDPELYEISDYL